MLFVDFSKYESADKVIGRMTPFRLAVDVKPFAPALLNTARYLYAGGDDGVQVSRGHGESHAFLETRHPFIPACAPVHMLLEARPAPGFEGVFFAIVEYRPHVALGVTDGVLTLHVPGEEGKFVEVPLGIGAARADFTTIALMFDDGLTGAGRLYINDEYAAPLPPLEALPGGETIRIRLGAMAPPSAPCAPCASPADSCAFRRVRVAFPPA